MYTSNSWSWFFPSFSGSNLTSRAFDRASNSHQKSARISSIVCRFKTFSTDRFFLSVVSYIDCEVCLVKCLRVFCLVHLMFIMSTCELILNYVTERMVLIIFIIIVIVAFLWGLSSAYWCSRAYSSVSLMYRRGSASFSNVLQLSSLFRSPSLCLLLVSSPLLASSSYASLSFFGVGAAVADPL